MAVASYGHGQSLKWYSSGRHIMPANFGCAVAQNGVRPPEAPNAAQNAVLDWMFKQACKQAYKTQPCTRLVLKASL